MTARQHTRFVLGIALVDGLVLQIGLSAFVLWLWSVVLLLQGRFRPALVSLVSGVLPIALLVGNARLAEYRSHAVLAAVERFCLREGRCPSSLRELVPGDLSRIPRARFALTFASYEYACFRHPHVRWFTAPPFETRGRALEHLRCTP